MNRRVPSSAVHASIARVALIAFALRALIPAGFMPSADHPFTLSICPDGLPVELLTAGANDGSLHHAHTEHGPAPGNSAGSESPGHSTHQSSRCDFAVAVAAPRPADIAVVAPALEIESLAAPEYVSLSESHRFLLAQPRAPPHFV